MVSLWQIIRYTRSHVSSRQLSDALRKDFHAAADLLDRSETTPATEIRDSALSLTGTQDAGDLTEQAPPPTAAPSQVPAVAVATQVPIAYPNNPFKIIDQRFTAVRRKSTDIVGWLTLKGIIDEPVVQRDNFYFLQRDYLGKPNVNGAIFLDEACSIQTRPSALILYGHNMKTGTMFGSLRNYENLTYYKRNALFNFDSLYEKGEYVIFSVATIRVTPSPFKYVGIHKLTSDDALQRLQVVNSLKRFSIYSNAVDVMEDDQILLLVTCVEEDQDRRVVAARRVRDDEDRSALMKRVDGTRKR